jgi:hypothetical protein
MTLIAVGEAQGILNGILPCFLNEIVNVVPRLHSKSCNTKAINLLYYRIDSYLTLLLYV